MTSVKVTWPHWKSHDLTDSHMTPLKVTWPHSITCIFLQWVWGVGALYICADGPGQQVPVWVLSLPSQVRHLFLLCQVREEERDIERGWGGGRVRSVICTHALKSLATGRPDIIHRNMECIPLPSSPAKTHTHSDLPWYKVFFRAMDKISDLKLDHQVINLYRYWLVFCTLASVYMYLYVWQSQIEIEYYSVAYFALITEFEAL